jgi:hypothetical protein
MRLKMDDDKAIEGEEEFSRIVAEWEHGREKPVQHPPYVKRARKIKAQYAREQTDETEAHNHD